MKLVLEITLDNDSFACGENPEIELARILKGYAENYELGLTQRVLVDINGNSVGTATIIEDEPDMVD